VDERRLYLILAGGAAAVVAIALIDLVVGGGGEDAAPATTTTTVAATTTSTAPGPTTTAAPPDKELHDLVAQADVRTALAAMKIAYRDRARYPSDPAVPQGIEPGLQFAPGIATNSGVVGLVYIDASADGQVACASARSRSGELFLIKEVTAGDQPGMWFARGAILPTQCDDTALQPSW